MLAAFIFGAGSATIVCVALFRHAYGLLAVVGAFTVYVIYKAIGAYERTGE